MSAFSRNEPTRDNAFWNWSLWRYSYINKDCFGFWRIWWSEVKIECKINGTHKFDFLLTTGESK